MGEPVMTDAERDAYYAELQRDVIAAMVERHMKIIRDLQLLATELRSLIGEGEQHG
jgi:hemerythrin-like domain-containing protein